MMVSFVLSFFPRDILDEILNLIESVSEDFPSYSFNPSECHVLHVTRLKTPIETKCFLHDTMLDSVSSAKYLGVTISDDLSWSTHIDNITKSANQTLGFLKRNIRVHNKDLKSETNKTLVRPQLEYASTVCPLHCH